MKYGKILRILRIIAGMVFVISGILKGIDPEGSAIKFAEYFEAAGIIVPDAFAIFLAISLVSIEFITGFSLITGLKLRWGKVLFLIFMLIFTPVTLILALTNPVTDCGCFGDAIKLSNWQTFYKNIPLLIIAIVLILSKEEVYKPRKGLYTIAAALMLIIIFQTYNILFLPVVDFRPFHVGSDIKSKLDIPEDAEGDKYETTFIYTKDGIEKEFTLENYPAGDTTWTFVDQKSTLISRGYAPEIAGFSLVSGTMGDMTELILNNENKIILVIAYNIDKSNKRGLEKGLNLMKSVESEGGRIYLVTSSPESSVLKAGYPYDVLYADETMLKTVIRSNPGFITLQNGVVISKNSWRGL